MDRRALGAAAPMRTFAALAVLLAAGLTLPAGTPRPGPASPVRPAATGMVIRMAGPLDVSRASKLFPLSTATSTVWTWHSAPPGNATLPAGWTCAPFTRTRDCGLQPMMTLTYGVARLALDGTAPAGRQVLHVLAGHLQAVRAAPVTRVSVSVSFDGGKTWHEATVTGSGGTYRAAFTAAAGTYVTLRVAAADAAGGTVTETITSAYRTGR
jgi:hypothetical protein